MTRTHERPAALAVRPISPYPSDAAMLMGGVEQEERSSRPCGHNVLLSAMSIQRPARVSPGNARAGLFALPSNPQAKEDSLAMAQPAEKATKAPSGTDTRIPITVGKTTFLVRTTSSQTDDPESPTSDAFWRELLGDLDVPAEAVPRLARKFAGEVRYAIEDAQPIFGRRR